MESERTYTYEELCAAVSALDKAQRDDPIVSAYALHSFLEGRAEIDPRHLTDASRLSEWLVEAAHELDNAHAILDEIGAKRINPGTGRGFTLAARIAHFTGART